MIFLKDSIEKEGTRVGMGLNKYSIAPDIEAGCEVDVNLDYDSKTFKIVKVEKEVDLNDMEVTIIADKYAVLEKVPCNLNIVLLGKYMYIELIEGAIMIKNPQDGKPMLLYNKIDVSSLGSVGDIVWLDTHKNSEYFEMWSTYANDMMFQVEAVVKHSVTPITSIKLIDKFDMSNGAIAQEIEKQEQAERTRALQQVVRGTTSHEAQTLAEMYKDMQDDRDYDMDEYDEYDEEDDDLVEGIDY